MPALQNGTRLGPYEILGAVGAGGMGEVYRGRDTRLDRIVAIKVLAENLATDVTSRERFEREAKAISSLNHPNICVLHDVGREKPSGSDGPAVDFIVMEYLEGETLSARLAHGPSRASRQSALSRSEATAHSASPPPGPLPPMTVEEALAIAIQIAAALDRAHRQGVVHRDLKPGNVMITNGAVKLLDFGLARLSRADDKGGLGHGMVSLADLSMPTVSSPLTLKGTILGTLQYMAPEQLEGKEVDARADIFAFGDMLYEMLTGRKAFDGKSQASLIGAILDHQPPPVTTYQPVSPPILDDIVACCLAKDPDDRWQTARDLKRQLEWVSARLTDGSALGASAATAPPLPRPRMKTAAYIIAALLVGALISGVPAWLMRRPPAPAPVSRFEIPLATGQQFTRQGRHVMALSPDGTRLVYVANQQLFVRKLGELTATPLAGTEGLDPTEPVFSPDGQWVAFWAIPELRKVPIAGGTPVTLAAVENPLGASWQGDRILLGQSAPRGVVEVPANGGEAKLLIKLDEKNEWPQSPQFVAGGRAVVFALRTGTGSWDDAAIVVEELASGRRTVLINRGTDPHVLSSGHLVFVRDATLFAIAFNEETLSVTGTQVPIERGVRQAPIVASGAAQWAWSPSGSAVFVPGEGAANDRALVWVDRAGRETRASDLVRQISPLQSGMRVSPDGTRVAMAIDSAVAISAPGANPASTSNFDVWIWDIGRGSLTRLSFTGQGFSPLWTPDGKKVCFKSTNDVMCQSADGSGQAERIATIEGLTSLKSFTPDGTRLISTAIPNGNNDIVITTMSPPAKTTTLIQTPYSDSNGMVSPDGRWLAYTSNESGRAEIYVRPFPAVDQGRWQVSIEGGSEARWSSDGKELFFISGGGPVPRFLWAAPIVDSKVFKADKPVVISKPSAATAAAYDVAPDGRFLFHVAAAAAATAGELPRMVFVQNWFEELKSRMSATSTPP